LLRDIVGPSVPYMNMSSGLINKIAFLAGQQNDGVRPGNVVEDTWVLMINANYNIKYNVDRHTTYIIIRC